MAKETTKGDSKASQQITSMIAELDDWRGKLLARLRTLILEAADLTEEWKWNTAVWSNNGMICAAGAFKDHVKLNFFKGASLNDPKGSSTQVLTPKPPVPSISMSATRLMSQR